MPKFHTKPVVVEAVQWFPGVEADGVEYLDGGERGVPGGYAVSTHEGLKLLKRGDWIVVMPDGKRHIFKPEVFDMLFVSRETKGA